MGVRRLNIGTLRPTRLSMTTLVTNATCDWRAASAFEITSAAVQPGLSRY